MKLQTAILFACVATLALLHSVYGTPLTSPVAEAAPSQVPMAISDPTIEERPLLQFSKLGDGTSLPVTNNDSKVIAPSANADAEPITTAPLEPAVQLDDESRTLDDIVPDAPVNPAQS